MCHKEWYQVLRCPAAGWHCSGSCSINWMIPDLGVSQSLLACAGMKMTMVILFYQSYGVKLPARNQKEKLHTWCLCKVFSNMSHFLKRAAKAELVELSRRLGRGWEPPKSYWGKNLWTHFFRRIAVHGYINFVPSKFWVWFLKPCVTWDFFRNCNTTLLFLIM